MGLLEALRQQAADISGAQKKDLERLARYADSVDSALRRGFSYFLEAASYLNVINPENKRSYAVPNVGSIDGMRQHKFFVDYRTTSVLDKPRLDHFYVRYTSVADRSIEAKLDFIAADRVLRSLGESTLEFEHQDILNDNGKIVHKSIRIPCTMRAEIVFKGDFPQGLVRVTWRNVERFGQDEFVHGAEELDIPLLEEYVKFILGDENNVRRRSRHMKPDFVGAFATINDAD
jgi:hypothetical protein